MSSITFHIKKEGLVDSVEIPGKQISAFMFQKLLAQKLNTKQHQLTLLNAYTGFKINPLDILKDKSTVHVQRLFKSQSKISSSGIVSNQQLAEMGKKARYFMIKSSNEENIQKARQFSVWATTFANQDKLRSALLYSENVFLFFATNRSYQIKGLARMEKQPSKSSEKSFWSGVSNIRLGGNFEIKWLRKQPLTALQIEKSLGPQIKDRVMRFCDGQQIDGEIGLKLIVLFQVPTTPYYAVKQPEPQIKNIQTNKKVFGLGQILKTTKEAHQPLNNTQIPPPPPVKTISIIIKKNQKQQLLSNKNQTNGQKKIEIKIGGNRLSSSSEEQSESSSSESESASSSESSDSSGRSSRSRRKRKTKKQRTEKRRRRSYTPEKKKSRKDRRRKEKKRSRR